MSSLTSRRVPSTSRMDPTADSQALSSGSVEDVGVGRLGQHGERLPVVVDQRVVDQGPVLLLRALVAPRSG